MPDKLLNAIAGNYGNYKRGALKDEISKKSYDYNKDGYQVLQSVD